MGEMVEFASNGATAGGYLATPAEGAGPGVLVIQEWWGLNPQIKGVCDRLAEEGFTALAPDLYHGELATHTEMDKAGELMSKMPPDGAARDLSGAVAFLLAHPAVRGDAVGVIGFCMGGMLTLRIAVQEGARVGAAVAYYPAGPPPEDWSGVSAPVLVHVGDNDEWTSLASVEEMQKALEAQGVEVTVHAYEGEGHAFANEDREKFFGSFNPDAARQAWVRTLEFLRAHLG